MSAPLQQQHNNVVHQPLPQQQHQQQPIPMNTDDIISIQSDFSILHHPNKKIDEQIETKYDILFTCLEADKEWKLVKKDSGGMVFVRTGTNSDDLENLIEGEAYINSFAYGHQKSDKTLELCNELYSSYVLGSEMGRRLIQQHVSSLTSPPPPTPTPTTTTPKVDQEDKELAGDCLELIMGKLSITDRTPITDRSPLQQSEKAIAVAKLLLEQLEADREKLLHQESKKRQLELVSHVEVDQSRHPSTNDNTKEKKQRTEKEEDDVDDDSINAARDMDIEATMDTESEDLLVDNNDGTISISSDQSDPMVLDSPQSEKYTLEFGNTPDTSSKDNSDINIVGVLDKHTTEIETENSEDNSKMKLDSIKMDWMKDDSEEEEYTLEFGNTNDSTPETSSEDSNYDDNSDIDISSTTPTTQKSVNADNQLSTKKGLIYGRSKVDRYAQAKLQYNSMKDSVDQSPGKTTSVLRIYFGCYTGQIPGCSGRVQPAQVAALIRRVLPAPPPVLRNEIEHELYGRASPGTEEKNTCETQVLNELVTINLLDEEGFFTRPWKINPRICLAIGSDRREHYKCQALAEVIKQVYLSDCNEVMIWANDILRALYTEEELEYLEGVLSSLDQRKKVTINLVRNFLAGRSLVPVINIINECEVALNRIGEVSSNVNPLADKSEDTPKQKKRNALALQLMNQWLAAKELPDWIKKAVVRAQLLLIQEKDDCRKLVKSFRSAFNNSKTGLTQLDNNQPHHITAGTPRGEEIVSKEASTLLDGRHQSSDTPSTIISACTRSSTDHMNSEWSTHETIYMEASMAPTSSSQTTTLKVPINQVAIVIADLMLSEVLVTKEDREDNLYIFHDFKQRTTLFSKVEDGLSGHLLLISSGRAKAAATPRTTRISGYSIVIQIYRDLCKRVGIDPLFSRDIDIDPMSVARAEDERRLAREKPNDVRKKKLKDLEKEQLDESTLLLNSTLNNISWTRMDKQLRDETDRVVYPLETTEERTERQRVEQKKKEEWLKQLKAKKKLDQDFFRLAEKDQKKLAKEKKWQEAQKKRLAEEIIEKKKRMHEEIIEKKKRMQELAASKDRAFMKMQELKKAKMKEAEAKINQEEALAERYWREQAELRALAEGDGEKRLENKAGQKRLGNEDEGGKCPFCVGEACTVWCPSQYKRTW